VRLLVVYLLAPLLRGVAATSIAILLSVWLAPSRSRAVEETRDARPAGDEHGEPARCDPAREDASEGSALPPDVPASPEADPSPDGGDGEDEGSDDASDGDVLALPRQRTSPSGHARYRARGGLVGGALHTLRTRLGDAPEAPPPRA
jgi:hypothetical protein